MENWPKTDRKVWQITDETEVKTASFHLSFHLKTAVGAPDHQLQAKAKVGLL